MICKYCGSEIDNSLKQCSECGMPTENFKVPVPAPVKSKKKKKKVIDPDKIPANIPAIAGAAIAIVSIISTILGAIFGACGVGFDNLFMQTASNVFSVFAAILYIGALFFIPLALILALAGGILSIVGKKKKKLNQSTPLVSATFSLFAFVSSCAALVLFLLYVVLASTPQ
jgi:hypothetical protein